MQRNGDSLASIVWAEKCIIRANRAIQHSPRDLLPPAFLHASPFFLTTTGPSFRSKSRFHLLNLNVPNFGQHFITPADLILNTFGIGDTIRSLAWRIPCTQLGEIAAWIPVKIEI